MSKWGVLCSLLVLLLSGCQNESLIINEEITRIEVFELEEASPSPEAYQENLGKVVKEITDPQEIQELLTAIEDADVRNLEDMDINLPSHKMRFFQNNLMILSLGYYPANEERKQSAFIDLEKQLQYTLIE